MTNEKGESMRDPGRIDPTLTEIGRIWRQHPDWRLCQLLANAKGGDLYHVEDDEIVKLIQRFDAKDPA